MCGISGVFRFHGASKKIGLIESMNFYNAKRGPDAEGFFEDEIVSLGHRRLSIIDTSESANQPMQSNDGNLIIIYNGELYNYIDLKNQLVDYKFKTNSDTEVILAAYLKWGVHCLRAFNGIFSLAIYDKIKKEVFIARDRLGIKPLYYSNSNQQFLFSSSLRAILNSGYSLRKISKQGLEDYLRYQTVHAPNTIIEDIFVLKPGNYLKINEEDGVQFFEYWHPTQAPVLKVSSLKEAATKVRQQLEKSIEKQMVADVPFGAFLSGGVDSSVMVALMSKYNNQPINTFSVTFQEDAFSEKQFAQKIADLYKTNHHEIVLSVNDFKELIPDALSNMDHPSGDGPNTFVVSKKTQEQGIKMAISGLGGDELFAGYSIFKQIPELQSKKWIKSFPGYIRKPLGNVYKKIKNTIEADKIGTLIGIDNYDVDDIYQYYRQVFSDEQIVGLLKEKKLSQNAVYNLTHQEIGYKTKGWHLNTLSKISVAEMSTYMQNVLLRDTDQMSMANSLEVRVPFLDHELVELLLAMPDLAKTGPYNKNLLIKSCEDLLPKEIYDRPKMGFMLPYEIWMKNEMKDFCIANMNELKKSKLFDDHALEKIWNQFLNGNKKVTWSRIWILVVLGFWIKENNVNS